MSLWFLAVPLLPLFTFFYLPCTSVKSLDEVVNVHIIDTEFGISWNHDAMILSVTLLDLFFKNNFLCAQYLIFLCHLRGNVSVLRNRLYHWTIMTPILYPVLTVSDIYVYNIAFCMFKNILLLTLWNWLHFSHFIDENLSTKKCKNIIHSVKYTLTV